MTTYISHAKAFRDQAEFAPESKLKIGSDIWTEGTAGSRLYEQVLSKHPGTVQKAIDKAATLDPPFTAKQVMGHLRWIYTAGELEVDGKSYVVQAKAKEPKAAKAKVAKPKDKAKAEAKVAATRQRRFVKTKRAA